jgi:hypothetical protein
MNGPPEICLPSLVAKAVWVGLIGMANFIPESGVTFAFCTGAGLPRLRVAVN